MPLGKHYSLQWAEEELNQQLKEGARFNDMEIGTITPGKRKAPELDKKFPIAGSLLDESYRKIMKKSHPENSNETLNNGPLTQRLISALIAIIIFSH